MQLLKKEEDLNTFFETNTGSTKEITTMWEASKVFIRGKFIAQANKKEKSALGGSKI